MTEIGFSIPEIVSTEVGDTIMVRLGDERYEGAVTDRATFNGATYITLAVPLPIQVQRVLVTFALDDISIEPVARSF